jgi:protein associated with RNAse G/E
MKTLAFTLFLFFSLSTMIAMGKPFMDDFNRPDNKKLGNDWITQADGTIKVEIVNQEALISGKQATDWVRAGLSRVIEDETKVYFDFLANENFNVHIRIDDTGIGAYIDIYAWPAGPFSHASSPDGAWPGWTEIPGSTMIAGQYNKFGVEKEGVNFIIYLNDKKLIAIKNEKLLNITKVLFASDAAANTAGSLHIDNIIIGDPTVKPKAVESSGKVSILWGKLKKI